MPFVPFMWGNSSYIKFSTWTLGGHTLTRCDWLKLSVDSFPINLRVGSAGNSVIRWLIILERKSGRATCTTKDFIQFWERVSLTFHHITL